MAEISDITIKRTQDSLGKIIKKPVLTDKLLRKPPFKFLHDIINAVRVAAAECRKIVRFIFALLIYR